jgi:cell fate regulator YaaT (PSP1 superfamily)
LNGEASEPGNRGSPGAASPPPVARVVGVQYQPAGAIHWFDPGAIDLGRGDEVVVEGERGPALAHVIEPPRAVEPPAGNARLRRVLRRADEEDLARDGANRRRARDAQGIAAEMIRARRLPMKVVLVRPSLDGEKVTITFFAENRIDFRELVRDLAQRLRLRVEMRQIGARDETKLTGGLGPCGRELCCSSWLREFHAVSVKMAKEQDLSLNPSKLAGMCGRLKCCLRYEYETYLEIKRSLPRIGAKVMCVKGDGVVVRQVPIRESVVVRRHEDGVEVEATLEDLVQQRSTPA